MALLTRGKIAIQKYGIPFLAVLILKLAFIPLLPDLMKGLGGQIHPDYSSSKYGPRSPEFDTASCAHPPEYPSPIVFQSPDFPSYIYFHIEVAKCFRCIGIFNRVLRYLAPTAPLASIPCEESFNFADCIRSVLRTNYRLPGYGTIVMALWTVAGDEYKGQEWLIILNILLGALAAVLFGDLICGLAKKEALRIPAALFYTSFPFLFRYEYILGSEGIYHSLLIFSIWSLYKSHLIAMRMIVLSGLFLCTAYTIRPLTIVMFAPFSLYILLASRTGAWRKAAYFLLPFAVFESIWMSLNYYAHGRLYITLKHHFSPWIATAEWWRISELLRSFGDNYYWFYYSRYRLPERAYTKNFGPQAEEYLVALLRDYYAGRGPERAVAEYASAWEESIKREKPFLYCTGSRFYAAFNFLTSHIQEHAFYTPLWQVGGVHAILYGYSLVVWIIVVGGGLFFSLYYLLRWRKYPFMAFLGLSGNIGWGTYAVLGLIQSRYILMGLVFLMVLVIAVIGKGIHGLRSQQVT